MIRVIRTGSLRGATVRRIFAGCAVLTAVAVAAASALGSTVYYGGTPTCLSTQATAGVASTYSKLVTTTACSGSGVGMIFGFDMDGIPGGYIYYNSTIYGGGVSVSTTPGALGLNGSWLAACAHVSGYAWYRVTCER